MSEQQKTPQKTGEKKLLIPEKSVMNISMKKPARAYVFIGKLILKTFGHLELHSLGRAS